MFFKFVLLAALLLPANAVAQYVSFKPMQLTGYEWQRYQYLKASNLNYGGPIAQMFIGAAITATATTFAASDRYYKDDKVLKYMCLGTIAGIGLVILGPAIPKLRKRIALRREVRLLELKATVDFVSGPRLQYTFSF